MADSWMASCPVCRWDSPTLPDKQAAATAWADHVCTVTSVHDHDLAPAITDRQPASRPSLL